MSEPVELAEGIWFDEVTSTIIVGIGEKISVAFDISEFWEFCENISFAKSEIKNNKKFIIGTYEEDGIEKTQLFLKSDTEEVH
jgi:hypothetical protein